MARLTDASADHQDLLQLVNTGSNLIMVAKIASGGPYTIFTDAERAVDTGISTLAATLGISLVEAAKMVQNLVGLTIPSA